METIELLTKEDLEDFKKEIIQEIKAHFYPQGVQEKKWLKSVDVRKLLSISPGTLQNLRINGALSYTKVGSILYYKLEDINKVFEGNQK